MKKLVLLAMATMVVFVACKKDGIYNPKKKISKITTIEQYNNPDYSDDTNTYIFKWDKNKLLHMVSPDKVDNFVYDKSGRLMRVECIDKEIATWYEYDGAKLSKVISYYGGTECSTEYALEYDGKKLVKITITQKAATPSPRYYSINPQQSPLAIICDPAIAQVIENDIAVAETQSTHKASFASTVSFEWSGKNISKVVYDYGEIKYEYELTYDDKINPLNGFLGLEFDECYQGQYIYKNVNNIKTMKRINSSDPMSMTYEYTYDGKWPVTIAQTYFQSQIRYIQQIEYKK